MAYALIEEAKNPKLTDMHLYILVCNQKRDAYKVGKSEAIALYRSQIEVDWSKRSDAEALRRSIRLGVCTRSHSYHQYQLTH